MVAVTRSVDPDTQVLKPPASSVWLVVDEDKLGTLNQGIGLLEAMGLDYRLFSMECPAVLRLFPRALWPLSLLTTVQTSMPLSPPWPNVVVGAGTVGTLAAANIRKASRNTTVAIALQNPRMNLKLFDWVIAPAHDNLWGENVLQTLGCLHTLTPKRLSETVLAFQDRWSALPQPLVAVLVGGPSRHFRFGKKEALTFAHDLKRLHHETGCGFLLNFSRRTPQLVRQILGALSKEIPMFQWDGKGKSPYAALLQAADYILVTKDSVSMLSDAAATDKPIFVYPLPGNSSKFEAFHQQFAQQGVSRPFTGKLEYWARAPFLETQRVAETLRQHLNL